MPTHHRDGCSPSPRNGSRGGGICLAKILAGKHLCVPRAAYLGENLARPATVRVEGCLHHGRPRNPIIRARQVKGGGGRVREIPRSKRGRVDNDQAPHLRARESERRGGIVLCNDTTHRMAHYNEHAAICRLPETRRGEICDDPFGVGRCMQGKAGPVWILHVGYHDQASEIQLAEDTAIRCAVRHASSVEEDGDRVRSRPRRVVRCAADATDIQGHLFGSNSDGKDANQPHANRGRHSGRTGPSDAQSKQASSVMWRRLSRTCS
eukprot:2925934-Prymnesium_polylepis.1